MAYIELRTSSSQSVEYGINGIFIPFSYVTYDISKLYAHALLNIYHGVVIGALDVGPLTPTGLNDIYESIRLNTPNTEIILTQDPYDALGNVVRFLSTKDDSIGRDGDILVVTTDYKMYKRENGIYVFKFQMQGGGGGVAVAAQWNFSEFINNSIGVDGDLLLRPSGQLYKKINGAYEYQMTVVGQPGHDGVNGIDGTRIFLTIDSNYTGLASENDINIVNSTEMYKYISGNWVSIGSIKGDKGLKGDKGNNGDTPEFFSLSSFTNSIGKDGDIILDPTTFKIYKKISGAFVLQSTLVAPEGSKWAHNSTVNNTIGNDGDFLLIDTGDVYKRVSGTYILQTNIKGPPGNTGNDGASGTNGVDGADGNKIYFVTSIDNNVGVNGDVQVVNGDFYQRVLGVYVLKFSAAAASSGSGYIDWAIISNTTQVTMTPSYTLVSAIGKISEFNGSSISCNSGSTTISSGGWKINFNINTSSNCSFFVKITVGTTTLFEKHVKGGTVSFSEYIELTSSEPVEIYLKSPLAGVSLVGGIVLELLKLTSLHDNRIVPSIINIDETACPTKNKIVIPISVSTYNIDMTASLLYIDIIQLDLYSNSVISINDSPTNGKKLIIYVNQADTVSRTFSFDNSNLVFDSTVVLADMVFSTVIGQIDMIGLEFNTTSGKWRVMSFLKGVF
jgi:hypothetical protein